MAGIDDFLITDPVALPVRAPTATELGQLALVGDDWIDRQNHPNATGVPAGEERFYLPGSRPNDMRNSLNALLIWAIQQEAGGPVSTSLSWTDTTGATIGGVSSGLVNGTFVTVVFTGGLTATATVQDNAWSVTVPAGVQTGPVSATAPVAGGGTISTPGATYTVPVTSVTYSEQFTATTNIINNGYTLAYTPTDPNMATLIGHSAGDREADYGTEFTITGSLLRFVGDLQAVVLVGDEFTIEYTA